MDETNILQIGSIGDRVDLLIRQGATFGPFDVTMNNPDGTPVNLSDITFRGQIRKLPSDLVNLATFGFEITDAANGKFNFFIDAIQTASLMAGLTVLEADSQYYYDIEYTNETGIVNPFIYGDVKVFREVTK